MANPNRIPFIPKMSRDFKPMKHYYCESDSVSKLLPRSTFMRILARQSCPVGQIYIDFDGGYVYLFPFESERAERFMTVYREFEAEYKRFYREQKAIRAGRQKTVVHLDHNKSGSSDADDEIIDASLITMDTPETEYLAKERLLQYSSSFNALSASDREILTDFLKAGCNARELARRLGKDPSGVLKHVKRAAKRLQQKIEENS